MSDSRPPHTYVIVALSMALTSSCLALSHYVLSYYSALRELRQCEEIKEQLEQVYENLSEIERVIQRLERSDKKNDGHDEQDTIQIE